jgi:hypothetical protein
MNYNEEREGGVLSRQLEAGRLFFPVLRGYQRAGFYVIICLTNTVYVVVSEDFVTGYFTSQRDRVLIL